MFGHNPDLSPQTYDPEGAKVLLAEAGYPSGLQLTLRAQNDRYVNDARIIETVASMFTRIGVQTEVLTMPAAMYFTRRENGGELGTPEFSAILAGWGTETGETMSQDLQLIHAHRHG